MKIFTSKKFRGLFLFSFLVFLVSVFASDTSNKTGKASFYHDKFHGRLTSNGEIYDKNDFTAAHRTLPFNSIVHVLNKQNGKSVIVRINDRGPFIKSRIIDLSRTAAESLDMVPYGIVPVTIHVLTILDHLPFTDSMFVAEDIWDCFGNKIHLEKTSVLIWITDNWKHAFYTASKLTLENKIDKIGVRISGPTHNRAYEIVATSLENKTVSDSLIMTLKKQGFKRAHTLK